MKQLAHVAMRGLAALCAVSMLTGCFAGLAADRIFGSNKTPAQYELKKEPLLILVDRRSESGMGQDEADRLALLLEGNLVKHEIGPMVTQAKVMDYRSARGSAFDDLPAIDRGKALGASQVLLVEVRSQQTRSVAGVDGAAKTIEAKVKVIDVATGQARWPATGEGKPVSFATTVDRPELVYEGMAQRVGRLFYEWER